MVRCSLAGIILRSRRVRSHGAGFNMCVERSLSPAIHIWPWLITAGNFSCTPDTDMRRMASAISPTFRNSSISKPSIGFTLGAPNSVLAAFDCMYHIPPRERRGQLFISIIARSP